MENLEFDKLFEPSNKSVLDFFRQSGAGYYIPEYQRGYSWDKDNINQLLTDISDGVDMKVIEFAFDSRDTGSANDYLPHNYNRN